MEEILDELEKNENVELSKNWRDLLILLSILLSLGGAACLWYGVLIEIEIHDGPYATFIIVQEIKMGFILIGAPLAMIISGLLLFFKKTFAWIGAITSGVFVAAISTFIAFATAGTSSTAVYLISLLCLMYSGVLLATPYRKHFRFKPTDLIFIFAIPLGLAALLFIR